VLKPWSAAPPRLRAQDEVEIDTTIAAALVSTALSSVDESEGK
jgi:hypothetical protein